MLTRRSLSRLAARATNPAPAFARVALEGSPELGLGDELHVDTAGELWIGSHLGLHRLDRQVDPPVVRPVALPFDDEARWVTAMADDGVGGLWLGTYRGLFHRSASSVVHRQAVASSGVDDRILDLAIDATGRLWIATAFGAFVVAEPLAMFSELAAASSSMPLAARASEPGAPLMAGADSELPAPVVLPSSPGAAVLIRHSPGPLPRFWMNGILRADDDAIWAWSSSTLFRIDANGSRRFGVGDERFELPIVTLAKDRAGGIWLGTDGAGLAHWARSGLTSFEEIDGARPIAVSAIRDSAVIGELLVMAGLKDRPAMLALRRGGELLDITPRAFHESAKQGWGWGQTTHNDSAGEWWIPTGEGLLRFAPTPSPEALSAAEPKALYTSRDGLAGDDVFRLFEDSRGDLWISTLSSTSLTRWSRDRERFEAIPSFDGYVRGAPTAFAEDPAGDLWIGLYLGGLARKRGETFRFFGAHEGLLEGLISALLVDGRGRLWVGGFGGLTRSDDPRAEAPVFRKVASPEGRWAAGVRCLAEDAEGRIYIGGDLGVDRLEPETGSVTRFTTADGLASNLTSVAHRDARGDVWIGTNRGLTRLDTDGGANAAAPPRVRLVSLQVGGEARPISALGEVDVRDLVLPAGSRRLDVGFSGLTDALSANVRFQVRLRGVDEEWSAPSGERRLTLAGLA
ncbi:MAG: hypothetical protein K8H90_05285, partial [Thermoanaerobaculia bacterium]|nr:hypothetical protein [Thermoanaerobaculia bacterium]